MLIRTQFPDLFLSTMLPALDELIFNRFDRYPPQFTRFFRVLDSKRSIEQTSEIAGLGLFNQIPENSPTRYDDPIPGFRWTYTHLQYGLGFRISRVMVDDDRFSIITKMAGELGRSAKETIEIAAASVFNNGFNSGFPGPDGQPLFSTTHPVVKTGGTQNNTPLAGGLDLDIPSLEVALTDFRLMVDPSGKKVRVTPRRLIVAPQNEFAATEIMTGEWRSDTANRTVNAFKNRIGIPDFEGVAVWEYLTEHAVLLAKIINHLLLGLVHPTGHRDEQEPERIKEFLHVRAIIASLPHFPNKSCHFSEIQFLYTTGFRRWSCGLADGTLN
jgi:Mu-like prophage major head subunit gpT